MHDEIPSLLSKTMNLPRKSFRKTQNQNNGWKKCLLQLHSVEFYSVNFDENSVKLTVLRKTGTTVDFTENSFEFLFMCTVMCPTVAQCSVEKREIVSH